MQLVEQTIIDRRDPRFQEIDQAAFAAKNLYNVANYLIRQSYIFQGIYLDNVKVFHQMKTHEAVRPGGNRDHCGGEKRLLEAGNEHGPSKQSSLCPDPACSFH